MTDIAILDDAQRLCLTLVTRPALFATETCSCKISISQSLSFTFLRAGDVLIWPIDDVSLTVLKKRDEDGLVFLDSLLVSKSAGFQLETVSLTNLEGYAGLQEVVVRHKIPKTTPMAQTSLISYLKTMRGARQILSRHQGFHKK